VVIITNNPATQKKRFFERLRKNVHPNHWNMWFGSFDIDTINDEEKIVTFVVGNLFLKERLKNKYGSTIARTVKEVLGSDYRYTLEFSSYQKKVENTADNDQQQKAEPLIKKKPIAFSSLNEHYTFERFIPGGGNTFAYNSAIEITRNPGKFNPLFIYGEVGLGKTHILQAIAHDIMKRSPQLRVHYITSEQFMNNLVTSIKTGTTAKFREKFRRNLDVLLIDDIQFLIGKKGIQNELFHTFNELYDAGKQIAFCSDRPPEELGTFHNRLVSRFQMGLVVEMAAPDMETRKKIIKKFAEVEDLELPDDVTDYLAEKVSENIRRIYGYLVKLIMANKLKGKGINLITVKQMLNEIYPVNGNPGRTTLTPDQKLFNTVEETTGLTRNDLVSKSRKKKISETRMIAMYIAVKCMNEPVTSVANWFKKSHSSVNYSINKMKKMLGEDNSRIKGMITTLKAKLNTDMDYAKDAQG